MIRDFRTIFCAATAALLGAASGIILAEEPSFGTRINMDQRSSGNVYVTGQFDDGVTTEFLVDTGSGYVTISKSVFRQISKQAGTEYLRTIRGALANGKVIKLPIYRVAHLSIGDQCELDNVEIAVMPGESNSILGINALRQKQPFAMQFDPPQLLLSNCGSPVVVAAALTAR